MKSLITVILACFYLVCEAQESQSFRLSGTVNIDSATIRLFQVGSIGEYPTDFNFSSLPVKQGKFEIGGKINHPYEVMLLLDTGGIHAYVSDRFFIDTGYQSIVCDIHSLREMPAIHNASMSELMNAYRSPEFLRLDTIKDDVKKHLFEKEYLFSYAQKHPDSYVALWTISHSLMNGYDPLLDSAFGFLSPAVRHSNTGLSVREDLNHLSLTATGKIFPEIDVYGPEGKTTKLNYLENKPKYILIDFWFSHCGPCIGQFPDYKKIVGEYGNKGFTMIGISSDASAADIALWKYTISANSLNWIQYRTDKSTMDNLRIHLAPWNFLLDSSGKILATDLETEDVAAFLRTKLD